MLAAAMLSFSFFSRNADAAEEFYYAYTTFGERTVRDILVFENLDMGIRRFEPIVGKLIVPGGFETPLEGKIVSCSDRRALCLELRGVALEGDPYDIRYELTFEPTESADRTYLLTGALFHESGERLASVRAEPVSADEVVLP
jgi:hypothetical protein